jgi:hypothetical protein
MQDLDKALADITAIRSQMARGAEFRGYGPMTMAATGVLAVLAALLQGLWLPEPAANILGYLALWVATAGISVALIGTEMVARTRRIHSGLADEMIHAATEQFIPAGVAGALLTFVLYRFAPQSLWMLPGLWQIVFSLGLFASPARDVRRRRLVSRRRTLQPCVSKRRPRLLSLCHGAALRGRTDSDRARALSTRRGARCRRLA